MGRYASAARRYRWLVAVILALVCGPGLAAAYAEYANTHESMATVWVLRVAPDLTATNPDDPSVPVIQTVASQQVELLSQLLKTRSFVRDVAERTSLRSAVETATDETQILGEIRRHFRFQTLGTNMLSISFTAHDPRVPPEMVKAAIAVRQERVARARIAGTTAVSTLYQREFEVAQAQALDAQRELDQFNQSNKPPLSAAADHHEAQLRLALDMALARLNDLKGRIDRAMVAPAVLEMSGMEFQVVDEPREATSPGGGARSAAILAAVAVGVALALAALLVLIASVLADQVAEPADIGRLAPARLFATVPRVTGGKREVPGQRGLRASLVSIAFGDSRGSGGAG